MLWSELPIYLQAHVTLNTTSDIYLLPTFTGLYRVGPQESGGRAFRNQTYIMISVAGDAVLVDYDSTDTDHAISSMQLD